MAWYQDAETGAIVSQRNENTQSLALFNGYMFEHLKGDGARFIKTKNFYSNRNEMGGNK